MCKKVKVKQFGKPQARVYFKSFGYHVENPKPQGYHFEFPYYFICIEIALGGWLFATSYYLALGMTISPNPPLILPDSRNLIRSESKSKNV